MMATKLSVVEQKWREERTNHDDCKLQLKKAGAKSKHYQVHASEYLHLLFLSFVFIFCFYLLFVFFWSHLFQLVSITFGLFKVHID